MAEVNAKSLARNSVSTAVLQVWQIGSRFVLTPIIISQIGLAGYGTWTLLFGICAYMSMFNASFGFAYMKYTAEYDRRKDYDTLSDILSSGVALVSALGIIPLVVVWLFHIPILCGLNVPEAMLRDARLALMVIGAWLLLKMSVGSSLDILVGLQRLDLQRKLTIVSSVVEFFTSLCLLWCGLGLLGLAIGFLFAEVLAMVFAWFLCLRLCPRLRVSPFRATRRGLRQIASLGGRFQLLAIIDTLWQQGTRFILSALCGIEAVGIFEIATKILGLGRMAAGAVIVPMMPAFANLHSDKADQRWQTLYTSGSRILAAVCVASFGFIAIFADAAIVVWTGQAYPLAAWTVRVLTLTYYLHMLTGVGAASLRGQGTVRLEICSVLIGGASVLCTIMPGYWLGGFRGIVFAYASYLTGRIWLLVAFARQQSISVSGYFYRVVIRPVLVGLPVITAVLAMRLAGFQVTLPGDRIHTAIELSLWGVAFSSVIGVLMWFMALSRQERHTVSRLFPSVRQVAKVTETA